MTTHTVVSLEVDGSLRAFPMDHREVRGFFGGCDFTFCGGLDELRLFALTRTAPTGDVNPFPPTHPDVFAGAQTLHGPILLVGSDADGEACDLDVDAVFHRFTPSAPAP